MALPPSPVSLDQIRQNVALMIEKDAPESDIDEYLQLEGVTPDQLRSVPSQPSPQGQPENVQVEPNAWERVMVRPGAAVRSAIRAVDQGQNPIQAFQEGYKNFRNVPTFQETQLERFAPKTSSTALNFLGGIIPSTVGLAADIATSPADVVLSMLPFLPAGRMAGKAVNLGQRVASSPVGRLANTPLQDLPAQWTTEMERLGSILNPNRAAQLQARLYEKTADIMDVPKRIRISSIENQDVPEEIVVASKYVKEAKNPDELINQLESKRTQLMKERESIIDENNFYGTEDYIKNAEGYVNEQAKLGHKDVGKMQDVIAEEKKWFNENKPVTRKMMEKRKEYLQTVTESTLQKIGKGLSIEMEPAKKQVLNILRWGLKNVVANGDKRIIQNNADWADLGKAINFVARKKDLIDKAIKSSNARGLVQKVRDFVGKQVTGGRKLTKTDVLVRQGKEYPKLIKEIESLRNKLARHKPYEEYNPPTTRPDVGSENIYPQVTFPIPPKGLPSPSVRGENFITLSYDEAKALQSSKAFQSLSNQERAKLIRPGIERVELNVREAMKNKKILEFLNMKPVRGKWEFNE